MGYSIPIGIVSNRARKAQRFQAEQVGLGTSAEIAASRWPSQIVGKTCSLPQIVARLQRMLKILDFSTDNLLELVPVAWSVKAPPLSDSTRETCSLTDDDICLRKLRIPGGR